MDQLNENLKSALGTQLQEDYLKSQVDSMALFTYIELAERFGRLKMLGQTDEEIMNFCKACGEKMSELGGDKTLVSQVISEMRKT